MVNVNYLQNKKIAIVSTKRQRRKPLRYHSFCLAATQVRSVTGAPVLAYWEIRSAGDSEVIFKPVPPPVFTNHRLSLGIRDSTRPHHRHSTRFYRIEYPDFTVLSTGIIDLKINCCRLAAKFAACANDPHTNGSPTIGEPLQCVKKV